MVLTDGREAFLTVLDTARSEVEFRFERARDRHGRDTPTAQRALLEEVLPVLRPRTPFDQVANEMRRLVTDYLGFSERQLDDWLAAHHAAARRSTAPAPVQAPERTRLARLRSIEVQVAAMLLGAERGLGLIDFALAQLPNEYEESFLREFKEAVDDTDGAPGAILAYFSGRSEGRELSELVMQDSGQFITENELEPQLMRALSRLRELHVRHSQAETRRELLQRLRDLESQRETATEETRALINQELAEIQRALDARDAERRLRVGGSVL